MKKRNYSKPNTMVVEMNCTFALLTGSNDLGTETDRGENYCRPISDKDMWDDNENL